MTITKLALIHFCFLFLLDAGPLSAQRSPTITPASLSVKISESKPDSGRVKLLLDLGSVYLLRPGSSSTDIHSALNYFNQALVLSRSVHSKYLENEALKLIGDSYLENANLYEGKKYFLEVIHYFRSIHDKRREAETWDRLAECIFLANHEFIDEKIRSYERASLLYHQLNDTLKELDALQHIAIAHFNEGSLRLAEKEIQTVLAGYQKVNYPYLVDGYDLLAEICKYKGASHRELYYRIQAVESMKRTSGNVRSGSFLSKLAQTYMDLGMYRNGDVYYKKALIASKLNHNYEEFFNILLLNVKCLILEKKPKTTLALLEKSLKEVPPLGFDQQLPAVFAFANAYHALNNITMAEQFYLKAIQIAESRYHQKILTTVNYVKYLEEVADFYVSIKQFKKSQEYVVRLRAIPKTVINPGSESNIQLLEFKIDSASGSYVSAIRHFEEHKVLDDSILSATKSKQIAQLQIQYETEKKDKELQLKINSIQLLQKHSQVQNIRFKQEKMVRNLIISGSAMLILLLGITFNRYKLNRKSNLLLQSQQLEINKKNQALLLLNGEQTTLLKEKEWLLREIHHRVKNNLQITISLLNIQSAYLDNEQAIAAIRDSQRRMHSMSLIHQKLYLADNLEHIDMAAYIPELVMYLKDSFRNEKETGFELEIQPVHLNVSQAVPLGLILNEAITNAIKYAFPGNSNGTIYIAMFKNLEDSYILTINDNGIGLPKNFESDLNNSLGLILMKGLTAQIQGDFMITSGRGTTVTITFKDLKPRTEEFNLGAYETVF